MNKITFWDKNGVSVLVDGRYVHEVESDKFVLTLWLQAYLPLAKSAGATEYEIDGKWYVI